MSSPAEILPNVEIIYTSAACDACDKYHVCTSIAALMTQVLGVKIFYWPQNVKVVLKLMRKVYTVLKQILVLCRKISQKYQIGKPKIK